MSSISKYSDYLEVVDFPSEINLSSIQQSTFDWKKTFPHKTFVELLKTTELMLGRQNSQAKKSLWIEGAYGTGKSRIVWTLKTLLECSDEDFLNYFNDYEELRAVPDLRDKLMAHRRNGKIITAYKYSTGDIASLDDFIMAIYKEVSSALKKANVPYEGEDTLRGGIVKWLEDADNRAYFGAKIQKPEYRSLGSFAGMTPDEILNKLNNSNVNIQLIRDILFLAKKESIMALCKSMDDLTAWLTEVIDKNNLKAIVFFWDEFSGFFKNNRNYIDTFQKFNELSNNKPFNMVIVTHSAIFDEKDAEARILRDRFVQKSIELPDTIAFDLIAHVIDVKETQKDLWETVITPIRDDISESRRAVSKFVWKDEHKGEDKLNAILPLHPLAALLLKNISTAFASNQRSMFNFIKNPDTDELHAFQWFINTHSPSRGVNDDDSLLTIDHLWNFFYEKGTDDYGSAQGRNSLDTLIRNILDTYAQNEDRLNSNDDRRVLKTVLMMQAMSEKLHNQVPLFLATEENIELAFDGMAWQPGKARSIALRLVREKILFKKPIGNSKEVFAATVVSGDTAKIEEIKDRLRKSNDTFALVQGFDNDLPLSKSQLRRFKKTVVSLNNFTNECNKITDEPQTYQIPLVLMFARTSDERIKIRKSLQEKLADERYKDIVFLDLTAASFPDDQYEQLLDFKAQEEYYRSKDRAQADNFARNANDILKEWKTGILKTAQTVYWHNNPSGRNCQSAVDLQQTLNDIVLARYPYSCDNVTFTEQMWNLTNSQPSKIVLLGITESFGGVIIKDKMATFLEENKQPLSALKEILEKRIKERLKKEGRVSVGELFDLLMEKGFMPCNVYAYLTGWLLREYADNKYRYSDGETSKRMTQEKLAEYVSEYIKHKVTPIYRYKEKYIEILTAAQKEFVNLAHAVWGISEDMSVDDVKFEIRRQLKKLDYPIWSIKELDCEGTEEFIDLLAQLANTDNSSDNVSVLVDKLGNISLQNPGFARILKNLLTPENAKKAMEKFLKRFEDGALFKLGEEIHSSTVMLDVKRSFTKDGLWLWDQETGEDEIRKLIVKYQIAAVSNQMLPSQADSLQKAFDNWDDQIKTIRIPFTFISEKRPEVRELFNLFHKKRANDLPEDSYLELLKTLQDSKEAFRVFKDQIKDFFKETFSYHLSQLSDDDVANLFSSLPMDFFYYSASDADRVVADKAKAIEESQLYFQLKNLWKERTDTDSPREWSEKYKTPILIMVPDNELDAAKRAFDAVNQNPQSKSVVRDAIDYLKKDRDYFKNLKDVSKINETFQSRIVGKFSSLLGNPDEVREELHNRTKTSVYRYYDWFNNRMIYSLVEQMGQNRYNAIGRDKVLEKLSGMDEEQIKKLLTWLVKNSAESGIKILTEYEGE